MNTKDFPHKDILCIDMKCFYASCIAMLEGLDVLKEPIAIIGNLEHPGSIVLAASPIMKEKFHIQTGNRRYEIPRHPAIKLFEPKMTFFLEMSMAITRLIAQFVPPEAIYVYSVDESFVDITGTKQLWGSPEHVAIMIREAIYEQFRIPAMIGMGPNMLMAKLALDLEAKQSGFAKWTYADVPTKLWPVKPLSKMWGIGKQVETHLNTMGIQTVGELAHADRSVLEKRFGVMGSQYYNHAWGLDFSILEESFATDAALSFSKGQTLGKGYYTRKAIAVVLLEMCEDVMRRTREAGYVGCTISLGLSYCHHTQTKGFHRSLTIEEPTNETMVMYKACLALLDQYFIGEPIRQLSVRLTNMEPECSMQLDLLDERKEQRRAVGHVMDAIRSKHGATAILRAASYTKAGTAVARNRLVGGHLA
ncbi:DNA polymerase thumb domain-containing protein [Lysinibacillus macroides]|uniref:UV damage repair protein UvrX n=1 Tax=Lysinibacillus macroides TaxID=33935 RepID=A0A0N0UW53_9BACI|nr:UV damage repair protein UvrX [Lysinibacillus macroides]KOY80507.1 UV damage repair protein UvrX [Lysinibacillus macroides]